MLAARAKPAVADPPGVSRANSPELNHPHDTDFQQLMQLRAVEFA